MHATEDCPETDKNKSPSPVDTKPAPSEQGDGSVNGDRAQDKVR